MNIIMLRWIYVEFQFILRRVKKEVRNYLKLSFSNYLKNLIIGKNRKIISIFFRIVFLLFIPRLILDILKIMFHFYYLIMYWFFHCLKFFLRFYILEIFWVEFFANIINFFQYFFLFTPFVRLNEKLKKRKKKLYIYIIERSIDYTIRIMWWRPKLRAKVAIPIEALEFLVIYFGVVPTRLFVIVVISPIFDLTAFLFDYLIKWRLFFSIIYYVWQYNKIAGVDYLRHGASLFHIALMLQRQGFEVPKSSFSDKMKAKLEYREYCKKYKEGELTPEILNDKALDIYIFLLDLFKETRYELKYVPITDFFLIMFPYEIFYKIFSFSHYLYIGIVYFLCFIFFPIVLILIAIDIFYEIFKKFEIIHFLFFRDLEDLAKEKEKIWDQIRENATKSKENKKWHDDVRAIWKKFKKKKL